VKGRLLQLTLLLCCGSLYAQNTVRINEVLSAAHFVPGDTAGLLRSDWIELYNPGEQPVQLLGHRIALNGMRHMIDAPLTLAPHERLLLWCIPFRAMR
jgi:hypothetical protein